MDLVLIQLEHLITKTSDVIWPVFVPFMLILGAYMAFTTIFKIQPKLTKPSKLKFNNMIGPASISLGAMVGTGAIVGVLGALSCRSYSCLGFNRSMCNDTCFLF